MASLPLARRCASPSLQERSSQAERFEQPAEQGAQLSTGRRIAAAEVVQLEACGHGEYESGVQVGVLRSGSAEYRAHTFAKRLVPYPRQFLELGLPCSFEQQFDLRQEPVSTRSKTFVHETRKLTADGVR
jgi:hypothetical protein